MAIEMDDIDAQKFLYYKSKDDVANKEKYIAVSNLIVLMGKEKWESDQRVEKYKNMIKSLKKAKSSDIEIQMAFREMIENTEKIFFPKGGKDGQTKKN